MRRLAWLHLALAFGFIHLPVGTLVLFSFQGSTLPVPPFDGPSLRWYGEVLADDDVTAALLHSLVVATGSSTVAAVRPVAAAECDRERRLPHLRGGGPSPRTHGPAEAAPMPASVELIGLNHSFGAFHALKDISLTIEAGEYVTLLGPSGCGKTTLLSVLGGFVQPSEGEMRFGGADMTRVPPARRPTTTMFQDYALFPHMTVRDNVGFGLRMAGVPRAERHRRAAAQLELVGLADAGAKRPHQLSGGQRQRVALARALAVDPNVRRQRRTSFSSCICRLRNCPLSARSSRFRPALMRFDCSRSARHETREAAGLVPRPVRRRRRHADRRAVHQAVLPLQRLGREGARQGHAGRQRNGRRVAEGVGAARDRAAAHGGGEPYAFRPHRLPSRVPRPRGASH